MGIQQISVYTCVSPSLYPFCDSYNFHTTKRHRALEEIFLSGIKGSSGKEIFGTKKDIGNDLFVQRKCSKVIYRLKYIKKSTK